MKTNATLLILATCLLFSCAKNPESYLEHLEGYWEIDEVTLKNGSTKKYKYNDTIDFISLEDSLTGVRKKLKPNFMGTFETSKSSETFQIKIENDSVNMYYNTPFDSWKETVLFANKNQLKVINKNDAVFLYKRYIPLDIN
ncbi:hypothetical protein ACFSQP_01390 [Bizionia sediminis]|uniref:Lipocalin-like domain-containing protein n=1 Tax=Bizionia sediminis TaxID=1737064 RepID=A0ABW5KQ87_9FLAO